MNRYRKRGKDAGEWIPDQKRYWFAVRVVEAKHACGLTVDRREAAILDSIPSSGGTTEMEPVVCRAAPASAKEARRADGGRDDVLARFDDNGNGRITCKEARRRGIAPVNRTHRAYRYMRAGDGVVCEWDLQDNELLAICPVAEPSAQPLQHRAMHERGTVL